jgi:hypothetical protein
MRLHALSIGYRLDADSAGTGTVHSVFARAVNLVVHGELWTLLSADRGDLPFGIRVAWHGFDRLGFTPGAAVDVKAGFVGMGVEARAPRLIVDCRAAPRWTPRRAGALTPGLAERFDFIASTSQGAWRESAAMASAVVDALDDTHALNHALARVIGRGPGSTPAGDDVVVGILAVLATPAAGQAGAAAARSLNEAMQPWLAGTTDISAHLLRQAARGWVGRSVHELIAALIEDAPPQVLQAAVHRVVATGATSGADLCAGLLACARAFLVTHHERAAA